MAGFLGFYLEFSQGEKSNRNTPEIPEIPEDDGRVVVPSGTSVPALQQGELFYNTSTKDLCIGA